MGLDVQQRMDQAAVAHINLGRFHQALARVLVPRLQAAHQQQVAQQVDVALRRFGVHAQIAGQVRHVEHAALVVCQHRPKAAQSFCCDAWAKLWDVAFQISANEVVTPAQTAGIAGCFEAWRKTATQPQRVHGRSARFQQMQRSQL